jgi:hypothetical protein
VRPGEPARDPWMKSAAVHGPAKDT